MSKPSSIQRSGLSPERLRRLHRALEGYIERGEIAGIVALIHRHGEEAHVETIGWQDREAQIPIQRDTLFRIMSMTKPITAYWAGVLPTYLVVAASFCLEPCSLAWPRFRADWHTC